MFRWEAGMEGGKDMDKVGKNGQPSSLLHNSSPMS